MQRPLRNDVRFKEETPKAGEVDSRSLQVRTAVMVHALIELVLLYCFCLYCV